jgi:hypothetical protein
VRAFQQLLSAEAGYGYIDGLPMPVPELANSGQSVFGQFGGVE